MIVEEIEKGEKSVSVEVEKEKGDEPIEKPHITMIVANVSDKGKYIDVDDDFSHSLTDLSTLSSLQAMKLATQTQIKASEDLLKCQSEDKEVISLATEVFEKILPSFSQDSGASPSRKLKKLLNVVNSNFLSLEKAIDQTVHKRFNEMRFQKKLKEVERDRVSLKTAMKSVEEELDEGKKIFKSCLFSQFTTDIDWKISDLEGKLVGISHSFAPQSVFPSTLEAQISELTDKIKGLNQDREEKLSRVGELRSLITPRMDTLLGAHQDALSALVKSVPSDLQSLEVHAFMYSSLISVLECFMRGWSQYLEFLKMTFSDIFKFI